MKRITSLFLLIFIFVSIFSCSSFGKELTQRERNIYNDYQDLVSESAGEQITEAELESRFNSLLEKYNTTEDEVIEIYYYETEGLTRLTQKEQEIADEFNGRAKPIRAEYKSKQDQMEQGLINEYGVSAEEFNDISTNYYYVKLYLVYVYGEENLPLEHKEKYLAHKDMMDDFSNRTSAISDKLQKDLDALTDDIANKHNTTSDNIDNIMHRESLGLVYKK